MVAEATLAEAMEVLAMEAMEALAMVAMVAEAMVAMAMVAEAVESGGEMMAPLRWNRGSLGMIMWTQRMSPPWFARAASGCCSFPIL